MTELRLECSLIRDCKTKELIGFSLVAEPQFEAEEYCRNFIHNAVERKAGFRLLEDGLAFLNNDDVIIFDINIETDYDELYEMMRRQAFALRVEQDGIITPGFKVIKEEKKNPVGDYIKLKRREQSP